MNYDHYDHDAEKERRDPAAYFPDPEPPRPNEPNDRMPTVEEMERSNRWYRWMRKQPEPTEQRRMYEKATRYFTRS